MLDAPLPKTPVRVERLADVADINPRLDTALSPEAAVSFVPMAALSAVSASVEVEETRAYGAVAKGYTAFRKGDVLVAKITPCFENNKIGQANLTRSIGFGSTEFHVVRAHPGRADPRYLLHYLRQDHVRAEGERKMTGSAGQRRVPENFVAGLEIPVPSLDEQRRIAAILDQADALRAKRRAALAQLDEMALAIFVEMFGAATAWSSRWPCRPFEETMRDETSRSNKLQAGEFLPAGSFPVIDQGQSPIAGYCDDPAYLCVSPLPCVVFGDHTRAVKLVRTPFVIGADGAKVLVPREGIDAVFLSYMMRFAQIPDLGYSRHMREVKRLLFPAPPLALQGDFARRIAMLEEHREALNHSATELDNLFSSLQHRAFRGDL